MVKYNGYMYYKADICNNCCVRGKLSDFEECNHSPCGKYVIESNQSVYKPTILCIKCKNSCSVCKKIFCQRHLNSSGGRNYCEKCKSKM
ncbi:hypothetical protein J4214_00695 [Candidatus Woesearchaeota archaeon]|nr:hypothetical protein [Candidatus Woesearchaeota archaeon]